MARLDAFFRKMVEIEASDLHLTTGIVPYFRLHGDMMPVSGAQGWTAEQMREVLFEITPERNRKQFDEEHDTDFAYEIEGLARFRANLFMEKNGPGGVFRLIPSEILTTDMLGLPSSITDLCYLSKGLVLVTGPTGSGKSTTLAAMVDLVNKTRSDHIITIEDPIEFVHPTHKCLVHQREVGRHTGSFKRALRAALREDPDIIMVGELRDLETIEIAIETAETGHLVFGTLHTTTAASTVDRIIDQFPADRQAQIRTMLAGSLKGVVAQTLCKKKPKGRVAALEILLGTPAVAALIREGKTHQLISQMQIGGKLGMKLMNDALIEHVQSGLVEPAEAYIKSVNKEELVSKLKHLGIEVVLPTAEPGVPVASAPAAAPAAGLNVDAPAAPLPPSAAPAPQPPASPAQGNAPGSFDDFEQFRQNRN